MPHLMKDCFCFNTIERLKERHNWLIQGCCVIPGESFTELAAGVPILDPAAHAPLTPLCPVESASDIHSPVEWCFIKSIDKKRDIGSCLSYLAPVSA
ncbi:hypothetical protein D9M70_562490 [compost metagenome]